MGYWQERLVKLGAQSTVTSREAEEDLASSGTSYVTLTVTVYTKASSLAWVFIHKSSLVVLLRILHTVTPTHYSRSLRLS